jgi:hypothetical protein
MRPGRVIWGLFLVILGALMLAAVQGWVDWGFVLSLAHLWPVILIILGVYFLLGRRHAVIATILMGAIVLGALAFSWASWAGEWGAPTIKQVTGPSVEGITEGRLSVDVGATRLDISGRDIGTTFEGELRTRANVRVDQEMRNGVAHIEVGLGKGSWLVLPFNMGESRDRLAFTLSSRVPWELELAGGAARMNVDLTDIVLAKARVDTGASSLVLKVGTEVVDGAEISVAGGVASYEIQFPRTLRVVIDSESGLTSTNYDSAFAKQADGTLVHDGGGSTVSLKARTGVSSLRVTLY